ncbi:hypothetical protein [Eubacterium sp. An3]|uniref:hypothetical protein n=1 Tax=Eubacterium sp. An3 TaxID=1965628 RepID=UPI00117B0698|nr:hypothetical protein [Eubacterium sp. An3]
MKRTGNYILTQKETRQPLLAESYDWIKQEDGAEEIKGIGSFVNHVEETAGKEETANLYEYWYEGKCL